MTLRADLTALLADAGIVDVDIDRAVEDEHVRWSAYRKVVAVVAAAQRRDNDRVAMLTETGSTEKIRNVARNRAGSRAVRDEHRLT